MSDSQKCMDRVRPQCAAAIKTMRQFLDDAERNINREGEEPEVMIERTLHKMAWGFANAASSLEAAISKLRDARKIRESEEARS